MTFKVNFKHLKDPESPRRLWRAYRHRHHGHARLLHRRHLHAEAQGARGRTPGRLYYQLPVKARCYSLLLQVTSPLKRGWLISPFGYDVTLQVWAYFAAVIPALLLYTLLFMETHICE